MKYYLIAYQRSGFFAISSVAYDAHPTTFLAIEHDLGRKIKLISWQEITKQDFELINMCKS